MITKILDGFMLEIFCIHGTGKRRSTFDSDPIVFRRLNPIETNLDHLIAVAFD